MDTHVEATLNSTLIWQSVFPLRFRPNGQRRPGWPLEPLFFLIGQVLVVPQGMPQPTRTYVGNIGACELLHGTYTIV